MRTLLEDANEILDLSRRAWPVSTQAESGAVGGALLRLCGPHLPYRINKMASDAVFRAVCGEEREAAVPLDQLDGVVAAEVGVQAPPKALGRVSTTDAERLSWPQRQCPAPGPLQPDNGPAPLVRAG
jgi:hypothetical protein